MIYHSKSLVLVRKGRAFYATLYQEVFFGNPGGVLKANTAAVPCTLVGGANGYLGILVSAAQYNTVPPGAPFVPSHMPGHLFIDPAYTQYQIAMAKTQYEAALLGQ